MKTGSSQSKPILELHKSGIQEFVKCPFRFFLSWIAKEPQSYDETIVLDKGTVMHQAFEDFFCFFDDEMVERVSRLSTAKIIRIFRELLGDYYNEYPVLKIAFDNFTEFEAKRLVELRRCGRPDLWKPALREFPFEMQLDNNITLKGTIDRIDMLSDTEYAVVEYKSSQSISMTLLRRELYFYLTAAQKSIQEAIGDDKIATNIGVIAPLATKLLNAKKFTKYASTRQVGFFVLEPLSKRSMNAMSRWVKTLVKAFQNNDFPKTTNEYACFYCPYKNSCPQLSQKYKHVIGDEE